MTEYTYTRNGRTWKLFGCAKRGCDAINLDYMAFGTGWPDNEKSWCLHHIPWWARLKVWWWEHTHEW